MLLNPLWWQFKGVLGREGYQPAWWNQGRDPSISMNELTKWAPFQQTQRLHRSTVSQRLDKTQSRSCDPLWVDHKDWVLQDKQKSQQVRALSYLLVCYCLGIYTGKLLEKRPFEKGSDLWDPSLRNCVGDYGRRDGRAQIEVGRLWTRPWLLLLPEPWLQSCSQHPHRSKLPEAIWASRIHTVI